MSIHKLRTAPDALDFDEATGLTYGQVPTYYKTADPDYDEGSQGEFADELRDPDSEEASQEYQPRKHK